MTWVWVQKLGDQECPGQVSHSRQMDVSAQQRVNLPFFCSVLFRLSALSMVPPVGEGNFNSVYCCKC